MNVFGINFCLSLSTHLGICLKQVIFLWSIYTKIKHVHCMQRHNLFLTPRGFWYLETIQRVILLKHSLLSDFVHICMFSCHLHYQKVNIFSSTNRLHTVCNFQSMKTPVELNSLLSKFFCYITWFVISPD